MNRNEWIGQRDPWRRPPRLFCFPYAGAGSHIFRAWRELLPGIDVRPVTLSGHAERVAAPLYRRIEPLVAALKAELETLMDHPFALFGHSMGALVAFELARSLEARGTVPLHLFVSGCRAPDLVNDGRKALHRLSASEFIEHIAGMQGTPPEVLSDEGLMQMFVPILKADFEIVETYSPSRLGPLSCSITALGGSEDIEDIPINALEPWRQYTAANFSLHMVPGDHFFIHRCADQMRTIILHDLRRGAS